MNEFENEQVFHGKKDIDYLFFEGAPDCKYLAVIFQAIPSAKINFQKNYNYVKTLYGANIHKLYIKDSYSLLGCFYLCENMNFDIEESVACLISETMLKYNIKKENVITCGSSNGGTSALYFAAKYGLGHAVCGAPQIRIGSFICSVNKETARFMMGEELPEENVEFLNKIVLRHITSDCKTDIRILTSIYDGQFKNHIAPLLARAKECNVPLDVTINDKIKCHHDIAGYYPDFLLSNIFSILLEDIGLKKPVLTVNKSGFKLSGAYAPEKDVKFTAKLTGSKESDVIYSEDITTQSYEYSTDEIMSSALYLDFNSNGQKIMSYRFADIIIDQGCFKYNGYNVDVDYENKLIKFKINVSNANTDVRYIYNLSLNKEKIIPSFSSGNSEQSFPIESSGVYRITFSIKIKNMGKIQQRTPPINVDFEKSIEKC